MVPEYEKFKAYLATLREDVKCALNDLTTSGRRYLSNLSEEIDNFVTLQNYNFAKKLTDDAFKVTHLAQEANCAILDFRHEEALAKLSQVQSLLYTLDKMPEVVEHIKKWRESQIKSIKEYAISELKKWLATIRDVSILIGKSLMGQTRAKLDYLSKMPPDTPLINQPELCITLLKAPIGKNPLLLILGGELPEIDVKPLLRIAHLFDLMELTGEFGQIFAENRKWQANIIIESPLQPSKDQNCLAFNKMLEQICGFCYVELHIRSLDISAIPLLDSNLENLWTSFLTRIQKIELEFIKNASSSGSSLISVPEQQANLMSIKWSHLFFSYSIRSFSKGLLDTFSLNSSLSNLFFSFVEILRNEHFEKIEMLFECKETFDGLFSEELMAIACNFSANFHRFVEGIPQVNRELEDLASRSLDVLLGDTVVSSIAQQLDKLDIPPVIQIVKSLTLLINQVSVEFPDYRLRVPLRLQMYIHSSLQPHLISQIHLKLDLLVRNANIDFDPTNPQPSPSPLFSGIQAMLRGFEELFSGVDVPMIHFEICQHLSSRLLVKRLLMIIFCRVC
jgi:hypothetical protein